MAVLVGEAVVLTNTFAVAGVATDPTTVSLAVTDPAGATVTYTYAAATVAKTATGIYTKTITPTTAGTWVYVWTGTGPAADIAPGFFEVSPVVASYLTVAQVRALPNLPEAKFSDAKLAAAIDWFETLFEGYTGVAWVPRTATDERHHATSSGALILDHLYPRAVSAVRAYTDATTSTAYTAAELADVRLDPSGVLRRGSLGSFTSGYGLVAVDYTHGFDTPPADVIEAAKVAVRDHLIVDYQANRTFSVSTEAGIVRTSTPGDSRPFGIPEVDAVANRRNHSVPSCA